MAQRAAVLVEHVVLGAHVQALAGLEAEDRRCTVERSPRVAGHTVRMRQAFVHHAELELAADEDTAAPGAAVTVELCGHWEHEPPCPVAAHHTAAERDGELVRLRVLFATEPDREAEVRGRIERALRTAWPVRRAWTGEVTGPDIEHGRRIAQPGEPGTISPNS